MIKQLYKQLVPEKTRIDLVLLINKLRAPLYFGTRYHCNCCNKNFRKFLPKGNIKRANAQCPYCGSLERTRLLHLYLLNETKLFNSSLKVLHIAPERCLYTIFKKLNSEYIDGDINPAYATHVIDLTKITYTDNYFDLIICSHVLGHIPDEAKAISELRRVLKPEGEALIMTLINLDSNTTFEDKNITTASERLLNYGEADLCRLHGLDFEERLRTQGFTVTCIDYIKKLPREICIKNSLGDNRRGLIYKCTK